MKALPRFHRTCTLRTCYNLSMCGRYAIPDPGDIPIRLRVLALGMI